MAEMAIPTAAVDGPARHLNKGLILSLICLVQLMVIIDVSIVNVALPSIQKALGFSYTDLQWVVNAYTLTFGGFLLLGGRASDLIGRRIVLVVGLAVFSIASLICGLAVSEGMLVIARGVQGLGGAIISPAALSILTVTFAEGQERNKALGVWGAVAGGGVAVGVILGGVLTEVIGWRSVFFVNVPIGILAIVAAFYILAESRDETSQRSFDFAGAITVTAGLVLFVYAMVNTTSYGWTSSRTLSQLGIAVALLVIFVIIEARFATRPLVPLKIFSSRTIAGANVVSLLLGMLLFAVFYFLTLYMQQVLHMDALQAGFAYVPFTLGIIVSSGIASVLVNRTGVKWLLASGLLLSCVGILMMAQLPVHGNYWSNVLPAFVVTALAMGFVFVPLIGAAISGVRNEDAGLASALVNTGQQVGGAVGLAMLATIATQHTNDLVKANLAHCAGPTKAVCAALAGKYFPTAFVSGFQVAFYVSAALAVTAAALALLTIPRGVGQTDAVIEDLELESEDSINVEPSLEPA